MARQLQNRLALASYKTQRGWENLDLDTIEPRVDQDLMRRRMQAIQEGRTISPHHAYSDNDVMRGLRRRPSNGSSSHSSVDHRKKRARTAAPGLGMDQHQQHMRSFHDDDDDDYDDGDIDMYDSSANHSFRNYNKGRSWKESHKLPQSSPGGYHHHRLPRYSGETMDMRNLPRLSFMRSPDLEMDLEREREDSPPPLLPRLGLFERHPQHAQQPVFHSSPPRTPPHRTIPPRPGFTTDGERPSDRHGGAIVNMDGNNDGKRSDGEGADLLLYLASSPSPNTMTKANPSMPPSTPPSKSSTALPSSMMNTPGGGSGSGGGSSFNFHDFVHITPSPAQGMWGGGSGSGRTPLVTNARRRLNFDGLAPPSPVGGSQESQGKTAVKTTVGLGMELGGELVSPTSGS
ncbi:hypothetical protein Dda_1271 [Drechslerella dactyloides]|uniref:Uncharacterized protein n=1 Tax=Drechslerella dactyloides TaxID=74499 RepID=A0AAD6J1P6_DREDA|nr:hypothetical protein Dda_1271 [Drechslerella dactyloides]